MADQTEYLTKEKFEELSRELIHLKTVKRKEVAESLEYSKSLGDLSENAEYHEAREMQANVEDRIMKLETMLKSSTIVSEQKGDRALIGSSVTIEKEGSGTKTKYKLVGSEEASIKLGKLSIHSPIGKAILGKKKGETVTVTVPGGVVKYKVTDIE
ncbi:MAG: transcription elongation factor GreA [Candidatus Paceibacterota bacterium]|jgi:transcription elongation factor GreA